MTTYVSLLRGVNVGGRNTLPMDVLRELCESLGFTGVRTFIQSGNVVFDSGARGASALERTIATAIARETGLEVAVMVRTAREIAKVVEANPFVIRGHATKALHVTFLGQKPAVAKVRAIDASRVVPDGFVVAGREVYLHTPNGYGRTKLGGGFFERAFAVPTTTRNWNTVLRLHKLSACSPKGGD